MKHLRNKIFSVEEANQLLPYLEGALDRLSTLGREAVARRREIEVLRAIAGTGASASNPDIRSLHETESSYTRTIEEFRLALDDVTSRGCIVRDLDLGLVDFYTMAQGRLVCLCWRRGESEVAHWHRLDEGFSGRRPLDELP